MTTKKYTVTARATYWLEKSFEVKADSASEAKEIVEKQINNEGFSGLKDNALNDYVNLIDIDYQEILDDDVYQNEAE